MLVSLCQLLQCIVRAILRFTLQFWPSMADTEAAHGISEVVYHEGARVPIFPAPKADTGEERKIRRTAQEMARVNEGVVKVGILESFSRK